MRHASRPGPDTHDRTRASRQRQLRRRETVALFVQERGPRPIKCKRLIGISRLGISRLGISRLSIGRFGIGCASAARRFRLHRCGDGRWTR
jgi:hypothetical protein